MPALLLALFLAIPPTDAAAPPTILILGDSLSAAYGLPLPAGWPHLLQQRLIEQQLPHRVINASISGETSDGGRLRLAPLLSRHRPQVVILALGANDGLRGLPLDRLRTNLGAMIETSQAHDARAILMAPRLPPNYGPYGESFHHLYQEMGETHSIPVIDFLSPFGADRRYFQSDGLHPTAEAQPLILDALWPALLKLIEPVAKPPRRQPPQTPNDVPSGSSPANGNG